MKLQRNSLLVLPALLEGSFRVNHCINISISIVLVDKPLPPSDLNSVSLGNNSALVSWSRPSHDGSSPITGYLLEHKRSDQVSLCVAYNQCMLQLGVT